MLPLLQLLPSDVAGQQGSAVGIHPIGEVLAGQADPRSLPALQLQLIHKAPLLHTASLQYKCTSAVGMLGSSSSVTAVVFTLKSDVSRLILLQNQGMAEGIVYVLTNPAMPGMVKIGRTSREMEARLSELYSTGVPLPFECAYAARVSDENKVERAFHQAFGPYRFNPKREFFNIDPEQAIALLELMALEDVTPAVQQEAAKVDVDAKASIEKFNGSRKRRPNLNYLEMGIPVGSQLVAADGQTTCIVVNGRQVEFEGEKTYITKLTERLRNSSSGLSNGPCHFWTYEGRSLDDIYDETYDQID